MNLDFLKKYIETPSPTGYEQEVQKLWVKEILPFVDKVVTDTYGTAVAIINPDAKYKFVIESHADEISWIISYITKEGFIYLKKNGGADEQIALSKRVNILTENGIVEGILGWPATHIRPKDKKPEATSIYVDCGCSTREEVMDMGIQIGDPVIYQDGFMLMKDKIVGRGLDNRIGGFMLIEIAKLLKSNKKKLDYGVYFINAVQEEVGQRGAQMIADNIKPNTAIVIDVCHDTNTPMIAKSGYGDLSIGQGPVISFAPSVHNNVNKQIVATAKSSKINIQRKACSNKTGTDADAIAYSSGGVATALLSIPLRYMHTSVETVHVNDVSNGIQLLTDLLINFNPTDLKYVL